MSFRNMDYLRGIETSMFEGQGISNIQYVTASPAYESIEYQWTGKEVLKYNLLVHIQTCNIGMQQLGPWFLDKES